MAALWVKGKKRVKGTNRLTVPAFVKHDVFPQIHGRHAELHLWVQAQKADIELRGGTLYVTGVTASKNKNTMRNTSPCKHCRFVLRENTLISNLIYWRNGVLVKEHWR